MSFLDRLKQKQEVVRQSGGALFPNKETDREGGGKPDFTGPFNLKIEVGMIPSSGMSAGFSDYINKTGLSELWLESNLVGWIGQDESITVNILVKPSESTPIEHKDNLSCFSGNLVPNMEKQSARSPDFKGKFTIDLGLSDLTTMMGKDAVGDLRFMIEIVGWVNEMKKDSTKYISLKCNILDEDILDEDEDEVTPAEYNDDDIPF